MQILGFDESATLPASLANGAGVATNRNATGPITLTVPASDPGTSYEVHCVNGHSLVLGFPPSEGAVSPDGGQSDRLELYAGTGVVVRLVAPGVWGVLGSGFSYL